MTAEHHTILEDPDIPLCTTCVANAEGFTRAVMDAWQDMDFSDETFCFVVLLMADLVRFEESRNPTQMDADYRRYVGRKLQSIGAAIAGDVN